MSGAMFATARGFKRGYDRDEVDEFFAHARQQYEHAPAEALSSTDVRRRRRVSNGATITASTASSAPQPKKIAPSVLAEPSPDRWSRPSTLPSPMSTNGGKASTVKNAML